MAFYENTLILRQDLEEKKLKDLKDKYNQLINNSSGKVVKIEEWGLLNLSKKIKKFNKGFFLHYKFEGNKITVDEIDKKTYLDNSIIRSLIVRYKKLDTENEFFNKKNHEKKK